MVSNRNLYLKLLAWFITGLAIGYLYPPAGSAKAVTAGDTAAAELCRAELADDGRKAFQKRYGERKPIKTCVARNRGTARRAVGSAHAACAFELADWGADDFIGVYAISEDSVDQAYAECVDETTLELLGSPYEEADEDTSF